MSRLRWPSRRASPPAMGYEAGFLPGAFDDAPHPRPRHPQRRPGLLRWSFAALALGFIVGRLWAPWG